MSYRLLAADEASPVIENRRRGNSAFVIAVDHASRRIPQRLGNLGLPASELERHIAWDIGALPVALGISEALDAPLVAQAYSRLVIDCNRNTHVPSSIPVIGELIAIPGNVGLTEAEACARRAEIFEPYHARLRQLLEERKLAGQRTILLSQHSMTNVFKGVRRPMHAAVLYNRDGRFARLILELLSREPGLIVGENEPYKCSDESDYTVLHHAEARRLPYVELEIRQDLIAEAPGQSEWSQRLARVLREAEQIFWHEQG
jgi:predicted N-formylglutamate amidohydrolase